MTREKWIAHIEQATGRKADRDAVTEHKRLCPDCPECKARVKTFRANKRRKAVNEAYRSVGMVRVKGDNGGTYWE